MKQAVQAFAEQAGADQQHQRESQLDDHKMFSETTPNGSRRAPAALREAFQDLQTRQAQNRGEGKKQTREKRQGKGKEANAEMESDSLQVRHAGHHVRGDKPDDESHRLIG